MGKEPELMCEVERYPLDIIGLTWTHTLGLEPIYGTLLQSGVSLEERQQVGGLVSPQVPAYMLGFSLVDKTVTFHHVFRLRIGNWMSFTLLADNGCGAQGWGLHFPPGRMWLYWLHQVVASRLHWSRLELSVKRQKCELAPQVWIHGSQQEKGGVPTPGQEQDAAPNGGV